MTKKTNIGNEEFCDDSCECHDEQKLVEIGNNVYTDSMGGSGMSDEMKKLIAQKEQKCLDK